MLAVLQWLSVAWALYAVSYLDHSILKALEAAGVYPDGVLAIGIVMGAATTAVGFGLLKKAGWAQGAATLLAFPLSLSPPLGSLLALLTWWQLSPTPGGEEIPELSKT